MLTPEQNTKIDFIIQGKVVAREPFTAFDITQALRRSEADVRNSDVRAYVHAAMEQVLDLGSYERDEFYTDPVGGWEAIRYSPVVPVVEEDEEDDVPVATVKPLSPAFIQAAGAVTFVDPQTVRLNIKAVAAGLGETWV